MKTNLLKLIFAFLLIVSFTACQSPGSASYDNDTNTTGETMETLSVPSDFKWNTHSDIQVTLESEHTGIFQITSDNGVVYYKAGLNGNGQYTFTLPVPSYEREVIVRFRGNESKLTLDSGSVFLSI